MLASSFKLIAIIAICFRQVLEIAGQDYYAPEVPETCKLRPVRGNGGWRFDTWYYDVETNDCRWMATRSFYGNANRFVSRAACMAYCRHQRTEPCETVTCGDRATCRAIERTKCESRNGNGNGYGNGNENEDGGYYLGPSNSGCPPSYAVCEIPNGNVSFRVPPVPMEDLYQWVRPERCSAPLKSNTKATKDTDVVPRMLVFYRAIDRKCKGFYFYPPAVSALAGQSVQSAIDNLIQNKNAFLTLEDCMSTCAE